MITRHIFGILCRHPNDYFLPSSALHPFLFNVQSQLTYVQTCSGVPVEREIYLAASVHLVQQVCKVECLHLDMFRL
jgi:hypothetical protein